MSMNIGIKMASIILIIPIIRQRIGVAVRVTDGLHFRIYDSLETIMAWIRDSYYSVAHGSFISRSIWIEPTNEDAKNKCQKVLKSLSTKRKKYRKSG